MDLLEHPLEAVAFRLYSLPDASAAAGAATWTCLAALLAAAAAAGLWRLRSSTPAAMTTASNTLDLDPSPAPLSPDPARSSERPPESTSSPAPSPKERYTAYYYDSVCVGCCDVDGDEEEEEEEEEEAAAQDLEDDDRVYELSETDPFEWEVVRSLPLRTTAAAQMGRYRNSTALNGSVVRLWDQGADGGLTAAASPRRRARVGITSAF